MVFGPAIIPRIYKLVRGNADDEATFRLDWSGFDFSVPDFGIEDMFNEVFGPNFNWAKYRARNFNNRAEEIRRLKRIFKEIEWYFINTPWVTPHGNLGRKSSGVPSGSNFTTKVDTAWNVTVLFFCLLMLGFTPEDIKTKLKALGDDGLLKLLKTRLQELGFQLDSLDEVMAKVGELAKKWFNMKLNPEKVEYHLGGLNGGIVIPDYYKSHRSFLGYQFMCGYLYRPTKEWFMLALYSEREVLDKYRSLGRLLSFWMIGAANDVHFLHFLKHFIEYHAPWSDPHRIRVSKREARHLKRQFGGLSTAGRLDPDEGVNLADWRPLSSAYQMFLNGGVRIEPVDNIPQDDVLSAIMPSSQEEHQFIEEYVQTYREIAPLSAPFKDLEVEDLLPPD